MIRGRLIVFGWGFTGRAAGLLAAEADCEVVGTSRAACGSDGQVIAFDSAGPEVARATHVLVTAAPDEDGDPVLAAYGPAIRAAPSLRWIGYMSTTGVYGDRNGGWVDEDTPAEPSAERSRHRLAAEQAWRDVAAGRALDIFRLAGIYGPGRSAIDDLRGKLSRRVGKAGHRFGRIHRDDIAAAAVAAMGQSRTGPRVLNLADDEPATSADVIAEAARLLGRPAPDLVSYDTAAATMSPMARSFWAENRRVASIKTQFWLGLRWRYPSYREGLRAIIAEQVVQDGSQD